MTYISQTLNKAAEGTSFQLRVQYFFFILASLLFLLPVPWLVAVISITMLWYGLIGWSYKTAPARWFSEKIHAVARRLAKVMLKDERNSPYLISLFGIGVFTPTMFVLSYVYQSQQESFNWWAVLAYHAVTYGPYFVVFSQVATLIHKEGHEAKGMFKKPFGIFDNFFGRFIAVFYGHVPECYPMGHMRIHHKHDNAPDDVTSTVYFDRSQASRFLIYLFEFMFYWTGISVAHHHYRKGKMKEFRKMMYGMLGYYGLITVVMIINPLFGFAYMLLPLLSSIIFLAVINYTWHAWTDPTEPKNIYKNSITVLNGHYNVYNEDYHVEHHKRPQTHWEEYPINYEKHREEYASNRAIIFTDTQAFEIFFYLLFGSYQKMADRMVDLNGDMTNEDKIALLKHRLQPYEGK
jgi:fatty acid desaturase